MQILVVSSKYPPEYSGSGLRAHTTYLRLSQKFNLSFDVITSSVTTDTSLHYEIDGVKVWRITNKAKAFERKPQQNLIKRIWQGIRYRINWQRTYWREALPFWFFLFTKGRNYDVIHVFGNVTVTAVAISYAKMVGKPLIVEIVNLVKSPNQYEPHLLSWIFGAGFPKQTHIVCLSEKLRQLCLNFGYHDDQIWCRLNPINEKRFCFEPNRKNKYALPGGPYQSGDRLILQIAKFIPLKNQIFSVEVLHHLPKNFKLVLMGPLETTGHESERDQAYFQDIIRTIETHQLQDRVYIETRFVEDPENYMKAADVFVMPSTTEALGTPSLESIACGVPVITSDIPGVFERWIQNEKNGYICPLEAEKWAEKIQKAVEIPTPTLQTASQEILARASDRVIDQAYYDLHCKLAPQTEIKER